MTKRFVAPSLALAALATASTAQAQDQACVNAADLGDAVVYAMPIAYDAVGTSCARQLKSDGFIARDGARFVERFHAKQDKAWPGAFRLIKIFMAQQGSEAGSSEADMTAMIAALPEESLRPFVEGLVGLDHLDDLGSDALHRVEGRQGVLEDHGDALAPQRTQHIGLHPDHLLTAEHSRP
jgi:hypothetical protein